MLENSNLIEGQTAKRVNVLLKEYQDVTTKLTDLETTKGKVLEELFALVDIGVNETDKFTFKVLNKARSLTLKGPDYESFVNYWIAFKGSSYGLHDASWRSSFGGTIYKYNGSHGCVNMPYYKVQALYNMVEIGTPVYISY